MAIFNSYVSSPEGTIPPFLSKTSTTWFSHVLNVKADLKILKSLPGLGQESLWVAFHFSDLRQAATATVMPQRHVDSRHQHPPEPLI